MAPRKTAKYIRNLQPVRCRIRFASKNDPFHFTLEPRGLRNDTHLVPAELLEHPDNVRNLDVGMYEYITKAEKDKIEYYSPSTPQGSQTLADGPVFKGIVRPEDVQTGRATKVDERGHLVREVQAPHQGANVDEAVGPKRAVVPGSEDFGSTSNFLQTGVVKRQRADG